MTRVLLAAPGSPNDDPVGPLEGLGFAVLSEGGQLLDFVPWHERDDWCGPWASGLPCIFRGVE